MAEKDDFVLHHFLPYLLNQAAEECSLGFQAEYKGRYGMLRTEWRVLFHLAIFGELTGSEIGAMSRIHKTKISRAVRRLEERRFLTRVRDASDRRSERLSLTATGRAAYLDLREKAEAYDAALVAKFTPEEAALLRRMLAELAGR